MSAAVRITVTHPQKMWRIAGTLLALVVGGGAVAVFRGQLMWPAIGLFAGYAPALVGRVSHQGMGAPIARMNLASLREALPDITGVMMPTLFGFRDPAGRATVFPIARNCARAARRLFVLARMAAGHHAVLSPDPRRRSRDVSDQRFVHRRAVVSVSDADVCRAADRVCDWHRRACGARLPPAALHC